MLFRNYPGDTNLQAYLKYAIQDGQLSLATFIATFLPAARSQELHHTATLDILCKTALECHYASGLPLNGDIVPFNELPTVTLGKVEDCMALLRVASTLPATQFHQVTVSASQLLLLLLSKVTDITQISTSEAVMHFNHITEMMNLPSLSTDVRQVLGNILMSLTYVLGDEAKAAREAQMMHTLQLALGKSDIAGTNSDRDLVTCSLLLCAMVSS